MEQPDVKVETDISAKPSKVWSIISNFSKWNVWHANSVRVVTSEGLPQKLYTQMAGVSVWFNLRKVKTIDEQYLEWTGSFPFTEVLLNGTRKFTLTEVSENSCKLTQEETFGGLLSFLFKSKLSTKYQIRYQLHNEKIKALAELKI
ncbi:MULTISPECIES: SRPBCC domain-containing protein [Pseudoalteromonas]|uniref:Polyketide cyclase / dehydrase and lipid transport n=1 Tax=Pseudoalteromonas luteoviolacea (strain 2ta16) TaxID=1353533 RepID=V4HSB6_PSEL2|nr:MULTISPECIES: SRPBCC domain-containing protein [Pseudoalteromonas]ESP93730.1 hypothetical protein PL2TA16_02934 [Pseudoalteromonas luteoviolacea 2ta16]KZN41155.1 hypothetical protein N483_16215 [Pseudoalteromonas luteoviolacea NCIMB 1944]MCG7551760.1 SRPBCC domain-containing protein [Pseudoalteromonas sp. Of7M-16]